MKTFKYLLTTNTIWASFDGGEVQAQNYDEALTKAEAELQAALDKVNSALDACPVTQGMRIDMNMDEIEVTEMIQVTEVIQEKPKSQFTEIKTDFEDENGVVSIDGYRTDDDNEEGCIIGYFVFNTVYWRDPEYQFDPYVAEVVKELQSGN